MLTGFFEIVSRRAAFESSPPEWRRKRAAYQPLKKCMNQPVISSLPYLHAVTLRRSHDACIYQRIDSLPVPPFFTMSPGRLAPLATGTDST